MLTEQMTEIEMLRQTAKSLDQVEKDLIVLNQVLDSQELTIQSLERKIKCQARTIEKLRTLPQNRVA